MDNEEEDEVIFGQAASKICKEHLGAMLIVRENNMLLTGGKDIKPHCMSSFYRSFLTSRAANKLTGVLY